MWRWLIPLPAAPLLVPVGLLCLARYDVGAESRRLRPGMHVSLLPIDVSWNRGVRIRLVYAATLKPGGGIDFVWTNAPWRKVSPVD